jgi:hypothetical protein
VLCGFVGGLSKNALWQRWSRDMCMGNCGQKSSVIDAVISEFDVLCCQMIELFHRELVSDVLLVHIAPLNACFRSALPVYYTTSAKFPQCLQRLQRFSVDHT